MSAIKVLIVDDEQIICESLKADFMRMEHPWRYEVYTASTVVRAEEIYYDVLPQLVLTDIRMPKGSGLLLVSEIRRDNPDCKILVLSAYDHFDYVRGAFTEGADDYLLKPIAFRELEQRVRKLLEDVAAREEAEHSEQSQTMEKILSYIDSHIDEKTTAIEMAGRAGMSRGSFDREFREYTGTTFHAYLRKRRMELAMEYLGNPHIKIKQVAAKLGYRDDPQHFSRDFTQVTGMTPREYRMRVLRGGDRSGE